LPLEKERGKEGRFSAANGRKDASHRLKKYGRKKKERREKNMFARRKGENHKYKFIQIKRIKVASRSLRITGGEDKGEKEGIVLGMRRRRGREKKPVQARTQKTCYRPKERGKGNGKKEKKKKEERKEKRGYPPGKMSPL